MNARINREHLNVNNIWVFFVVKRGILPSLSEKSLSLSEIGLWKEGERGIKRVGEWSHISVIKRRLNRGASE